MGSLHAVEFANAAASGEISIDAALSYHLTVNHFPPVPESMIPACKEAILHARLGHWDTEIDLPEPVTYQGQITAPVMAIVDQHHLEAFIETDDDEIETDYFEEPDPDENCMHCGLPPDLGTCGVCCYV